MEKQSKRRQARGNLVTKTLKDSGGNPLSTEAVYTWSEDNLLLRADTPNIGYSDYLYDAGGDRIHKLSSEGKETYYFFNGLDVAYEEEDSLADGITKRYYIHALGRHVASVEIDDLGVEKTYFFHADYLGSVRMISDDNALVVWQKRYAPFGGDEEQSGTIENTYQFTGKGWDEDSQLFYFNARWYDADVGRFISEDPLWGNIGDPQSLNRFAYGRNNPYRFTDPTGRSFIEEMSMGDNSDGSGTFSDYDFEQAFGGGGDALTAREWYQDWSDTASIEPAYDLALDNWFMREMRTHVGQKYKLGKNNPHTEGGTDCSGIVIHVLETMGFDVPDQGADYIVNNWTDSVLNPRPGSLHAYNYPGSDPEFDHLSTVIDNNSMVHPSYGSMQILETTRSYNGSAYELRGMNWHDLGRSY